MCLVQGETPRQLQACRREARVALFHVLLYSNHLHRYHYVFSLFYSDERLHCAAVFKQVSAT